MELDPQAVVRRRFEHPCGLGGAEGDRFAKRIHRIGKARGRHCWQHLLAHERDVVVGPGRELRGQRVGAEKGGLHGERQLSGERTGGPQGLAFVVGVEPIARLDLDGGYAFGP